MASWSYKAIDKKGGEVAGIVEADSLALAINEVRSMGYFPTKVNEATGAQKRRAQQKKGAGDYATIATVTHDGSWSYSLRTGRLDDLSEYTWRITPIDAVGNEGTPETIGPELIVRRPDPPEFELTFNTPATTVTFSEAS